jgi:hypothetical protein
MLLGVHSSLLRNILLSSNASAPKRGTVLTEILVADIGTQLEINHCGNLNIMKWVMERESFAS